MSVSELKINGKEITLIGTAHISERSAQEVREIIEREQPDTVCVELCQSRYESIVNRDKWKNMDIFKIIKEKKSSLLLVHLLMSSFQKRMAKQLGVEPGLDIIAGIDSARDNKARLVLADRDIQTTFMRIWRKIGFFGKIRLFFMLILSMFHQEEINQEELEKLKSQDMITLVMSEFAQSFPNLKETLIDERDQYLAQKIKDAPGEKIVAVVGAGHVPGIIEHIKHEQDLEALQQVPQKVSIEKLFTWGIPILIIGVIASTFAIDKASGSDQIIAWILWNGSLAALGVLIAWGHPVSMLVAFIAAPITSINPLLAAGWFAGLAEAYVRRPSVGDFERISEDITTFKGFWQNKVTHILLVVILANLGSSAGTIIGGTEVVRLFIKALTGS
jgi:pheromone shutdown-related protein TraB